MFGIKESLLVLGPLVLLIIGMVFYSIFIFKFYHFIAHRDIIPLNLHKYHKKAKSKWLKRILYILLYLLEYFLVFPLLVLLWFLIFLGLLLLVSKYNFQFLLLIAMGIVSTVRIISYYNQELSIDLAKMLPLTLLVFVILDFSQLSFQNISQILEIKSYIFDLIYYFIFIIVVEFILRIGSLIYYRKKI